MTLREALTWAAAQLEQSSELRPDAARDASLLLRHVLGITHAQLLANPERELTLEQQELYKAAILRRLRSEPVQYITGEQEFYGLALRVTPDTLIPRPETELLVETVLHQLRPARGAESKPLHILDVGTGSGAIAIALAHAMPHARITATDISRAALEIAGENAARHGVDNRIEFLPMNLMDDVRISYDAVVSNPPYVPLADRATLHPQVRDYEPATALFAGEDGLDVYRRLIPAAARVLEPKGLLALEIGHGQRDALAELLHGWSGVRFADDLQGIPRVAMARRPAQP